MRLFSLYALIFLTLLLLPITGSCLSPDNLTKEPDHQEFKNIPLAQVNYQMIYLSQLMPRMRKIASTSYHSEEISPLVAGDIKKKAIHQLVTEELARQRAEALDIKVTEDEIEQDIQRLKKSLGDEKHFRNYLLRQNIDEKKFRDEVQDFLAVRKVIEREVYDRIQIDPVDLEKLYQSRIEDFTRKEKITIDAIIFFLDPKSPEATAEVEAVRAQLAEDYNNDLSRMPQTDRFLCQEFTIESPRNPMYSAAKELEVGEISEPIIIDGTLHILQMKEYHPKYIPPKEKVLAILERSLREEKRKEELEKWKTNLWQEADIEIFETTVD